MLQTLQLKQGTPYTPALRYSIPLPAVSELIRPGEMTYFPGGNVEIGTDDRSAAYDNERARHTVSLNPFWIDVHPVTNGEFAEFIAGRRLLRPRVLVRSRMALAGRVGCCRTEILESRYGV